MIYSMPIEKFPNTEQYQECHTYQDENDFDWKIARVQNGFFVAYFGDPYLFQSLLFCGYDWKISRSKSDILRSCKRNNARGFIPRHCEFFEQRPQYSYLWNQEAERYILDGKGVSNPVQKSNG